MQVASVALCNASGKLHNFVNCACHQLDLQRLPLSQVPGHVQVFTHSAHAGEDWVDYDEDDAGRNLAEMFSISGVSPSPASYGGGKGTGSGVYGGSGGPTPYGMRFPPPPAVPSSSPAASSPPQTVSCQAG